MRIVHSKVCWTGTAHIRTYSFAPFTTLLPSAFAQVEITTQYRVEYALKTHRRDQLIEWIKGLLAVPFVCPTAAYDNRQDVLFKVASVGI